VLAKASLSEPHDLQAGELKGALFSKDNFTASAGGQRLAKLAVDVQAS
jgi:hypothetical protein